MRLRRILSGAARALPGRIASMLRGWFDAAVDLLYPPACPACGCGMPQPGVLCDGCLARCTPVQKPFCERCSLPFAGLIPRPFQCPNCAKRELAFDAAAVIWRSRGPVRDLVLGFKYDGRIALAEVFVPWLREALLDDRLADLENPVVVPVPLHPVRLRERGYNQAAVLGARLAKAEGWTFLNALWRTRHTTTQTALDRAQRARNLKGAFALRAGCEVRGRDALLVDDVLTTGATISACAEVLRKNGAERVFAVAVARA